MATASEAVMARYQDLLEVVPEADQKLMFGNPTCQVGRRMFFGVHATGLFLRLPPNAAEEVLAAGGTPFEPMPGRTMGGFFILPEPPPGADERARERRRDEGWVRQAYDHASSMPPKEAPRKRPAKPAGVADRPTAGDR